MSTRDEVLDLLEENEGYVSGADIASRLGVTGTAVWKAVRKLRSEGYVIDAYTNRGYMLRRDGDVLSERAIMKILSTYPEYRDVRVECYDTVDSTNTVCRGRAALGEAGGLAVVAACQTMGRGRRGRSFSSPRGSGLYMSLLLRPDECGGDTALRLTTMAAVAVCEAIEKLSGEEASIKWVNDIHVRGRKVCGILTEGSFDIESGYLDHAVVGIGINVTEPEGGFPPEIADKAGAVCPAGRVISRSALAAAVISSFMKYYRDLDDPSAQAGAAGYGAEYRRRCFVPGRRVQVLKAGSDPRDALCTGLDEKLRLIVRYKDGTEERLESGEISITI